jgi:hypothetical protein
MLNSYASSSLEQCVESVSQVFENLIISSTQGFNEDLILSKVRHYYKEFKECNNITSDTLEEIREFINLLDLKSDVRKECEFIYHSIKSSLPKSGATLEKHSNLDQVHNEILSMKVPTYIELGYKIQNEICASLPYVIDSHKINKEEVIQFVDRYQGYIEELSKTEDVKRVIDLLIQLKVDEFINISNSETKVEFAQGIVSNIYEVNSVIKINRSLKIFLKRKELEMNPPITNVISSDSSAFSDLIIL